MKKITLSAIKVKHINLVIVILDLVLFALSMWVLFQLNQTGQSLLATDSNMEIQAQLQSGVRFMQILLVGFLLFNIGVILLVYGSFLSSVSRATQKITDLGKEDMDWLTGGLASIASGDLVVKANTKADLMNLSGMVESRDLFKAINDLILHIQQGIKQLNSITQEPINRLVYVGSDSYRDGSVCGNIMGKLLNGKGQVAVFVGSHSNVGLELRRKGFQASLRQNYPGIRVVAVRETHEKAENSYRMTKELLQEFPNIGGFYTTDAGTPTGVARSFV
jgi:hypothetical protein